jgi:16S rRNA (guanine527-N7)-methyltransferase
MRNTSPKEGFTGNIASDSAVLGQLLERLALPPTLISPLLAHARSVEREADRLGLVSAGDISQVVRRHTADSILFALVRAPAAGERWADVGSGAGFPGLVLATCYPETRFTLVEPQKRRAGFLELQIADLGLPNAQVDARRLEEVEEAEFDAAVARALANPAQALRSMVRVLRTDGVAVVAASGQDFVPDRAIQVIALDQIGSVDSPGRFFMMTRGV